MTSMKVLCPESSSRGGANLHRLRGAHSLVIVTSGMLLPPRFVRGICARALSQRDARLKKKKKYASIKQTVHQPKWLSHRHLSYLPFYSKCSRLRYCLQIISLKAAPNRWSFLPPMLTMGKSDGGPVPKTSLCIEPLFPGPFLSFHKFESRMQATNTWL